MEHAFVTCNKLMIAAGRPDTVHSPSASRRDHLIIGPIKNRRVLFVVNHSEFFLSHRLPIANACREAGMHVSIATSTTPGLALLRQMGFEVHPIPLRPGGTNPLADLRLVASLAMLYWREKPDVVHQVTIKPVMYGSLAARAARVPSVVNAMSGLGFLFISRSRKVGVLRAAVTKLLRIGMKHRNMRMILQNPDDKEEFVRARILSEGQVTIIRGSGVDPYYYTPCPEPAGTPIVILPSRLLWDKGIAEYIEAVRILKHRGCRARFALVGGTDKNNPMSCAESDVQTWISEGLVEWWGVRNDMPQVFASCHVVILPSYREGLPKVLIEAASCERPIVSTDVPGCREIVRDGSNGFLVPARESMPLADALERLINSKELRVKMGKDGRAFVLAHFTLERVIGQTLEIYGQLIKAS